MAALVANATLIQVSDAPKSLNQGKTGWKPRQTGEFSLKRSLRLCSLGCGCFALCQLSPPPHPRDLLQCAGVALAGAPPPCWLLQSTAEAKMRFFFSVFGFPCTLQNYPEEYLNISPNNYTHIPSSSCASGSAELSCFYRAYLWITNRSY